MTRRQSARLHDIVDAIDAIRAHLARGDLHDGLVYDAVRVRLIEIGEAVKAISPDVLAGAPGMPGRRSLACATSWHTATSTPITPSSRT